MSGLRYGSVCSGIEAASVAWHPLGWRAAWLAEIEAFPSAVLTHHYPGTPNLGDITADDFIERANAHGAIDVLVGGTPCQSFSVAGLRRGLADPRGNLALVFLSIVDRLRPAWVVWENVPGVLSSGDGRDFGAFLGALGELGYGWSYRVLDAQYFGVAQRRRRVFVVGYLGDWRRAAAVLFERDCLSGNPPPRRETGAGVAVRATVGSYGGGFGNESEIAPCLQASGGEDERGVRNPIAYSALGETAWALRSGGGGSPERCDLNDVQVTPIAHSLRADGFDASEDGTGRGTPLTWGFRPNASESDNGVPQRGNYPALRAGDNGAAVAFTNRGHDTGASAETIRAASHGALPMVAFDERQVTSPHNRSNPLPGDPCHTLHEGPPSIASPMAVRRLTPMECERLQGFPDGYTDIPYKGKPAADGPRYKALGNSMAVPVMRWIGERIAAVVRDAEADV